MDDVWLILMQDLFLGVPVFFVWISWKFCLKLFLSLQIDFVHSAICLIWWFSFWCISNVIIFAQIKWHCFLFELYSCAEYVLVILPVQYFSFLDIRNYRLVNISIDVHRWHCRDNKCSKSVIFLFLPLLFGLLGCLFVSTVECSE